MKFTAIDFETANFKRQSVCSIGLAIVEDYQVVKTIDRLIKPIPNYFESINMSIHGITPNMIENEPTFLELWEDIKPFIENQQLVAHNASFDFSALRYVLDCYQIPYPTLDYFCSMLISKNVYPGLINYQLPTVCKHIKFNNFSHHNAVSDAVACANIMIQVCKEYQVTTLEELELRIGFSRGKIYSNSYSPFSCYERKLPSKKQLFDILPETTTFDTEHPFYGKRIVFTGALSQLSRNDAKQIVANIGGLIKPDSLSSKTNYLVVGTYDYNQFGEGFKSSKLKYAEELIAQGCDLEIISEVDFFRMVHSESTSFEITLNQIDCDSIEFLRRNKYNDFSGKNVYFSSDLSIERTTAFQHVGNCSGYGHDYDKDEISNSDYFIISDKLIIDLKNGIKNKSIIDFEKIRNEAQNRGNLKSVKLISESTFLNYIENRVKFQKGEIKMNLYEWEIKN
jgi:DNA polymerase III subunit epsilon